MSVKMHLKQICDLEKTIKETEMKIPKHKARKAEVEKNIENKRAQLKQSVSEQREKVDSLATCRKRRANFTFKGIESEKRKTIIICIITILIQAILTNIMTACFGANNALGTSIVYTIIYAVCAAVWLYSEYLVWLKFPLAKSVCCIIILAILFVITYSYYAICQYIGINIIGANIIITILIVAIEIFVGVIVCQIAIKDQRKEYNDNKRWLRESAIELEQLQKELELRQQTLVKFNATSAAALTKMEADIAELERFYSFAKKQLQDLYAQNVLHPNYQNWVAAATIYEYLDVGRCYELKGPSGAYNLFESELLAKKILDSLSAIHSSVKYYGSNIASSQMYIRNQLSECNRNVGSSVINTYGF